MAMSRYKTPPTLLEFVRELTVHRDGIAWMDIADRLQKLGVTAKIVTTTSEELSRWLKGGVPVVLPLKDGLRRHAVVAHDISNLGIHILDPSAPGRRLLGHQEFEEKWSVHQAIVIYSGTPPPVLDVSRLVAKDRTYRARELGLRAARVIQRPKDAARFFERAIAKDDSIAELHFNYGLVLSALGQRRAACRSYRRAQRLKPRWSRPTEELKLNQCP